LAGAVNKAFSVIRLLRRTQGSLTLAEIARSVKIAPSTAHSILSELSAQGAVLQDGSRRYLLGPASFYLGAAYVRGVPIYRGIWSALVELAHEQGLTGIIAVPWEHHHLILDVHNGGGGSVQVAFGGRVPIDAGAMGKAYFAWSGAKLNSSLVAHTAKSITSPKQYLDEIEQAKENGYATDLEEFVLGAGAVASAVTSEHGFEGIAALVGTPADLNRIGIADVGRKLASVAARCSYTLGDRGRIKVLGIE
jgi:DNA-binding IclR family transcriptional regulator